MATPRKVKPTTCAVCNHVERERIEALRASGASLESLARKFKVHKTHLAALEGPRQRRTQDELPRRPCDDRRAEGARRQGRWIDPRLPRHSAMGPDGRHHGERRGAGGLSLATLSGRLVEVLREIGKLTGEIERLNPSVNVTTNIAFMSDQRMIELQSGLLTIARTHPAARADIVALLRGLDTRPAMPRPNGAASPKMIEGEAMHVA